MTPTRPFSLLVSVYAGEQAGCLAEALESVLVCQTVLPAEIVLVEDGPLSAELREVLRRYREIFPHWIRVALPENKGLGTALNEGLNHCTYEWVARMDSDDIALPERFERQWAFIEAEPSWDVVGCAVGEFERTADMLAAVRRCPAEVYPAIKFRSPLNHPTVFFRKSAVQAAGGYRHCPFMEDYDLWIRLYANGARMTSLPDVLYLFRMTPDTYRRRGGRVYVASEKRIQKSLRAYGIISWPVYVYNRIVRVGSRYLPGRIRAALYRRFLRKKH
ncbi:MAG: glycosyltransferase [Bacteroidales bacterium]|nr:glycosyltransferase [Bacteroidales bacterium]